MEYCEGQSLREFIKEKKNKNELIEEEIIYGYILDICLGIKTIHDNNIIHRDLKPENLFLTKDKKNIKIGDFGIARQLDNQKQLVSSKIGTPAYAAPEVHDKKNEKYNIKADIWSFGCIIYELFTLKVCFVSGYDLCNKINKKEEEYYLKIDTEKYDVRWELLIECMLEKDDKERPNINEIYELIKKKEDITLNPISNIEEFKKKILDKKEIFLMRSNSILNFYLILYSFCNRR